MLLLFPIRTKLVLAQTDSDKYSPFSLIRSLSLSLSLSHSLSLSFIYRRSPHNMSYLTLSFSNLLSLLFPRLSHPLSLFFSLPLCLFLPPSLSYNEHPRERKTLRFSPVLMFLYLCLSTFMAFTIQVDKLHSSRCLSVSAVSAQQQHCSAKHSCSAIVPSKI